MRLVIDREQPIPVISLVTPHCHVTTIVLRLGLSILGEQAGERGASLMLLRRICGRLLRALCTEAATVRGSIAWAHADLVVECLPRDAPRIVDTVASVVEGYRESVDGELGTAVRSDHQPPIRTEQLARRKLYHPEDRRSLSLTVMPIAAEGACADLAPVLRAIGVAGPAPVGLGGRFNGWLDGQADRTSALSACRRRYRLDGGWSAQRLARKGVWNSVAFSLPVDTDEGARAVAIACGAFVYGPVPRLYESFRYGAGGYGLSVRFEPTNGDVFVCFETAGSVGDRYPLAREIRAVLDAVLHGEVSVADLRAYRVTSSAAQQTDPYLVLSAALVAIESNGDIDSRSVQRRAADFASVPDCAILDQVDAWRGLLA
ncbi:MAG TPA: hypothetical protein VFX70_04395 [Mycobacteriales bacterium]|nr:hypothetical protein [Mycobacteriales bacterium]